jgi:Flp pilus assembly protein TadD
MRRWLVALITFAAIFATAAGRAAAETPPGLDELRSVADERDRLAAAKSETTHPSSVPGVEFDEIDSEMAIAACLKALSERPDDARLKFQLARAFDRAEDFAKALSLYREAADAENVSAIRKILQELQ